jgi:hypothetical protein
MLLYRVMPERKKRPETGQRALLGAQDGAKVSDLPLVTYLIEIHASPPLLGLFERDHAVIAIGLPSSISQGN